ncbi:MAG TPA: hypothetical protein VLH61_11675 [Bacteroidales bacterium]|nr:hypothetical protein [Bacteroidales bacterium]
MIDLKEHLKLTGIYTFFAAFPAILQLMVYPIIEGHNMLGAEDFGYLAVSEALLSFLVIFCLHGMAISVARFYYDYCDEIKDYRKLVSTIFIGIVLRAGLIIFILVAFADFFGSFFPEGPLRNFESYGIYLGIIAFNRSVISTALSLYRSEKIVRNFILISIISGVGRSLFQVIGVLYFDLSFKGYLIGTALGGGIANLLILGYIFYRNGLVFSIPIWKQLQVFAFSLMLTDFMHWGILFFDRFMLLNYPVQLGIYDNAMKFAAGVLFISQGLAGSVQPELYRFFKDGISKNQKNIKMLSNIFIAENILVVGILALPLILFIMIFFDTELILSAGLLMIILVRYILNAQVQVFSWPLLYNKNSGLYFLLYFLSFAILVVLNLLLVPLMGFYGSITAFLFAALVQVISFYVAQKKIIPIQWNLTKVLFFPISVVVFAGLMEVFKIKFEINAIYSSVAVVIYIFAGLIFLYRNDLPGILRKVYSNLRISKS